MDSEPSQPVQFNALDRLPRLGEAHAYHSFLCGFDVLWLESAADRWSLLEPFTTEAYLDDELFLFSPSGALSGSRGLRRLQADQPSLYGRAVQAYVYGDTVGGYLVRRCILRLDSDQLSRVVRDKTRASEHIDTILEQILPLAGVVRVWPRYHHPWFCQILLIVPAVQLSTPYSAIARTDYRRLVGELRDDLGQGESVATPSRVWDLLLFPGTGYGSVGDALTCFWLRREEVIAFKPDSLRLPSAAFDLIDKLSARRIVEHLCDRLRSTPMGAEGAGNYLAGMRAGNLLRVYLDQHLQDRLAIVTELSRAEQHMKQLDDDLRHNWIAMATELGAAEAFLDVIDSPRRYDVVRDIERRYEEARASYSYIRALVLSRVQVASDHLRDLLNAHVADSNLRLQRAIRLLTFSGVLLGLQR